jgi:ABC-type sugar transport system ATPase subunit
MQGGRGGAPGNDLSSPGRDVNFEVRAGEIVGFAGWRSEIAKAIFSLNRNATGEVELNGKRLALRSSMAAGIGFAPEHRKRQKGWCLICPSGRT